jgi:tryptophan-rich sensory protein
LLCLAAGFIGSAFTTPAIGAWYVFLNKPAFNPPARIFAPVWTTFFLVFRKAPENKLAAVSSFVF